MTTARRDTLLQIQRESQEKWRSSRIFEEDAPPGDSPSSAQEKFLVTFPYPYCNGFLHIGHAFSLSKAEFVVGYKRMKNVKCLYPFGFHCTGMPIQTCANKLRSEIETYGLPPDFPNEDDVLDGLTASPGTEVVDKTKGKKGKAASKKSKHKFQWEILRESGIAEEILPSFADPIEWLRFFPSENVSDLTTFGLKADWRRSFITTEVNPYYDSFVRWQFGKLLEAKKIKFGKRNAVYSPVDRQPCADHDRASGEGVQPQEYTLIKLKLLRMPNINAAADLFGDREVYLPAATLRAETMYGQTNCWVLPTGDYVAYHLANGEVFICSEHSGRNMAFQDFFDTFGEAKKLCDLKGADLIGLPVRAPLASYEEIYVLPLMTVSMSKGTGIVTSVPSDAPDDYRGLMDLKEKEALRLKFGVKDEWVMPFEPQAIIDTPGFGHLAAVESCTRLKIRSQNDKDALARAKDEVYKAGFYNGVMLRGEMAGEPVMKAKNLIREQLLTSGLAVSYSEPEKKVVSRSGDECVVALCDQWYLEYGESAWRSKVEKCLNRMDLYFEETKNAFDATLGWLKEWACSRQFGLGTRLPWDQEWLIESLSDSTIYMAFYTVAHILQGGTSNLDGHATGPGGIPASDVSDAVWDFVMLGKGSTDDSSLVKLDSNVLVRMRREFTYWYPVDLRVSGKDLIGNHLTFYLYNHVAIFPEEQWPRGIRVNGHVLLDAEKMSKSTGNFLTLRDAMSLFTSDGVRFALADAADTVEDANFSKKTAEDAVLKLWTLVDFVEKGLQNITEMHSGPVVRFADKVFFAQLQSLLKSTEMAYERMMFRDAVKYGFFEMVNNLGKYREAVGADKSTRAKSTLCNMHRDVFVRYVYYQTAALAPVCPHTAEHIWSLIATAVETSEGVRQPESVMHLQWPACDDPDEALLSAATYLYDTVSRIRLAALKGQSSARPSQVSITVCSKTPEWQTSTLRLLEQNFNVEAWEASRSANPENQKEWWKFPSDTPKRVATALPTEHRRNKKLMPFLAMVRKEVEMRGPQAFDRSLPFDERDILIENLGFVESQLQPYGIHTVVVNKADESASTNRAEPLPGAPIFSLSRSPEP